MDTKVKSTVPKPFVFVLMPFDPSFDDIYKFGIKGAAEDAGAYAERVDEQIFMEGILDHIFNQINKADVIVADLTGRNPNVFYEVGYAHALGKTVLPLTQKADDIPFDLKQRQHTVYGGKIETLRRELTEKLIWAIGEACIAKEQVIPERFMVSIFGTDIPEASSGAAPPIITGKVSKNDFSIPIYVRNSGFETSPAISYIYLFASNDSELLPCEYTSLDRGKLGDLELGMMEAAHTSVSLEVPSAIDIIPVSEEDSQDDLTMQFRMPLTLPSLPPGAVEELHIPLMFRGNPSNVEVRLRLRIHSATRYHDYPFTLKISWVEHEKKEHRPMGMA
jgi:hypothetical protein